MKRLAPAPLSSVALFALWLLLARSTSAANILIALVLAVAVPLFTSNLRPAHVRVRHPLVVLRYIFSTGYDVVLSNFQVAWGVVAWRARRPQAKFVVVPLDLKDPVGLAALAMVTTVVPGTVWSELALDRSALLLHVWDVHDESKFIARFKARYEQPLREIFE
ncbi:MAG TPA: Na+/H+ antiporter subunit E [Polyangiales bacterium]|nr:Na+/H+ antiporter subunit E [Polyangiales bacterium]